jgi:hypothetical protein
LKDSWSEAVELAKKATPGEWKLDGWNNVFGDGGKVIATAYPDANAAFIAHVSPSRILEWEEERKQRESQLSAALQRIEKLQREMSPLVVLLRAKCSDAEWVEMCKSCAAALLTEAPQQGGSK